MASSHIVSHFLLLFFSLVAVSRTTAVFVSIDCGATDNYVDGNKVEWSPDHLYISTGENRVIPSTVSQVMSTLRMFPTRKKNCYSIDVNKGERLLLRASFYYGNYDKRSSPPSFDLQFDGNHWVTVTTAIDMNVYYEVIYVAKNDAISVCVAQTQADNIPFVSAIEVRSLEAHMYSQVEDTSGLFLIRRFNFGSNETVSYPDDTYDRIWTPVAVASGLMAVSSDSLVLLTDAPDQPPPPVMQTALTTLTSSDSILLNTNLGEDEVPAYINMYFAEMTELESTQKREFVVRIDEQSSDPVTPPYQSAREMTFFNLTASGNTTMMLEPTASSALPPIISALEVFVVSPLADGTNGDDVDALSLLQKQFYLLQQWSGDPCLPANFTWDWLACSSDEIPRITALNLNGFDLSSPLPDFSGLAALETIDLHNNSLSGEIPDFLGTMPNLRELVSGNPNLCVSGKSCDTSSTDGTGITPIGSTSSGKKKNSKLPVILGASIASFLVFWLILGVLLLIRGRRKAAAAAIAAAPAGAPGKPTGPPENMQKGFNGQVLDSNVNGANEYRKDIEQQMGSEPSHRTTATA
ncbi:probable LRR receptor-like serine/threonine-protein kinase At1g05700 [Aristolochia californica]|uniref:probable LRR receptor-like serine/threonine-protein kinase At1g05700 n=1 Tax=Aristolochia californica TaxID=171875 RepID=UPI0035DB04DE